MVSEGRTITIGDSAMETILEQFGWYVRDDGFVVDEDGRYAPASSGYRIHVDDVCGVAVGEQGEPVVARADFNDLCDLAARQRGAR